MSSDVMYMVIWVFPENGTGLRGFQGNVPTSENSSSIVTSRNGYQSPPKFNSMASQRNENLRDTNKVLQQPNQSFDVISIPLKAYRNVLVSYVVSPSEFYVQIEEESSKLDALMMQIKDTYKNNNNAKLDLNRLAVDTPCCAMFEDEEWYRGQIKEVGARESSVFFIDYGNIDLVENSKIKLLQREFFSLPPQALRCKSHNVSPLSGTWSDAEIDTFSEMTLDQSFVARFIESDASGVYAVNLVNASKLEEEVLNKEFVSKMQGKSEVKPVIPRQPSPAFVAQPKPTHIAAPSNLTLQLPRVQVGSREEVIVPFGLNPGEVFCQLKSLEGDFKNMMFSLQSYYNKVPATEAMVDHPHPSMICVAQFVQDLAWYRAEVKTVDRNSLTVCYVDYGNCETVDKQKVRSITQNFASMPIQGIKCRLKGIRLPGKSWPMNQNISKYFEGASQCHFIEKENDCFVVDILCDNRNVAELLVKDGLAASDSPAASNIPIVKRSLQNEFQTTKPQVKQAVPRRETAFVFGQLLSVIVSYVESPYKFWCQLLDEAEILEKLMADIEVQYLESESLPIDAAGLTVGSCCMAKYSADEAWYRAQIKSCVSAGEYEVFFIDYGNSEVTSSSQLAAVHPDFLSLPPQCFECRLHRAPPTCDAKIVDEFQSIVNEVEEFTAKVESSANNVCVLTLLYEKEADEVNASDVLFGEAVEALPLEVAKFLPPDVPLGPQEGYVTEVVTPREFFIQLAGIEDDLADLSSKLSEECEAAAESGEGVVLTNPTVGCACSAKYAEDNNWYRAELIDLQETTADIIFVDYGNGSSVPRDSLRVLSQDFLNVPPYAIKCRLNGIVPAGDQWADSAIDSFRDMVLDTLLGITFISKDIPATVNILKDDKDIAQSLVDLELAVVETCPETEEAYSDDHLTTVEDQLHSLPSDLSYPKRKLTSARLPIKICYIDSYVKFYCMPLELSTELDTVMKTLEILYSPSAEGVESDGASSALLSVLEDPSISMACVAKYSEDEAWYRATITDIDGDNIYVTFVDYGNTEMTTLENLRPLTPELIKIPPIAVECSLYAVQAVDGKEQQLTAKLEEFYIDEVELEMEVIQAQALYSVKLYHDGDLTDFLVKEGLVIEVTPPSESEVTPQLESEVTPQLMSEVTPQLESEVTLQLESEVMPQLESEAMPQLESEATPPSESVDKVLVDSINENAKANLKTAFVELPEEPKSIVPLRSVSSDKDLLVSVKFSEIENEMVVLYAVPNDLEEGLAEFQVRLQTVYNDLESRVESVTYEDFCVARSAEDEMWYRAQVVSCEEEIQVKFIDYGNSEIVTISDISKLLPEFLSEPQFSVKFCLSGCKVRQDKHEELQGQIDEHMYNEPILVKMCKYSHSVPAACVVDLVYGEINLVELLLKDKLLLHQFTVNPNLKEKFEATVESIVDGVFYVLPIQFKEDRDKLEARLSEVCGVSASTEEIDPGRLYASKVEECWSRVAVSVINNSSGSALVKCLDYGLDAEIELSKLVLLPEDLCHCPLLLQPCVIASPEEAPDAVKDQEMEKLAGHVFQCEMLNSYPVQFPLEIKISKKDFVDETQTLDDGDMCKVVVDKVSANVDILKSIEDDLSAYSDLVSDIEKDPITVETVEELISSVDIPKVDDDKSPSTVDYTCKDAKEKLESNSDADVYVSEDDVEEPILKKRAYVCGEDKELAESVPVDVNAEEGRDQDSEFEEFQSDEDALDEVIMETDSFIDEMRQLAEGMKKGAGEFRSEEFQNLNETRDEVEANSERNENNLGEESPENVTSNNLDLAENVSHPIANELSEALQNDSSTENGCVDFEGETPIDNSFGFPDPDAVHFEMPKADGSAINLNYDEKFQEMEPKSQDPELEAVNCQPKSANEKETVAGVESAIDGANEEVEEGESCFPESDNKLKSLAVECLEGDELESLGKIEFAKSDELEVLGNAESTESGKLEGLSNAEFAESDKLEILGKIESAEGDELEGLSNAESAESDKLESLGNAESAESDKMESLDNTESLEGLVNAESAESDKLDNLSNAESTESDKIEVLSCAESAESDNLGGLNNIKSVDSKELGGIESTESDKLQRFGNVEIKDPDCEVISKCDDVESVKDLVASKLEESPKHSTVEDNEWDERPECDIKPDLVESALGDKDTKQKIPIHEVSLGDLIDTSWCKSSGRLKADLTEIEVLNGSIVVKIEPCPEELGSVLFNSFKDMYSKKAQDLLNPAVSNLCAVHFMDNWYRAKILGVNEDNTLTVSLTDLGTTETVQLSDVRDLDMTHIAPRISARCSLASLYCPPEKCTDAKEFLSALRDTSKETAFELVEFGETSEIKINLLLDGHNALHQLISEDLVVQKFPSPTIGSGQHTAKMSHLGPKSDLYINLVSQLDDLQKLRDSMQDAYSSHGEVTIVRSGVYALQHNGAWVRGEAVSSEQGLVLHLVDSGETTPVVSRVYPLLPAHCLHPPFAIPCKISAEFPCGEDTLKNAGDVFSTNEFLVDIKADSESSSITACITDEDFLRKISNIACVGTKNT